jgi:hypothetical protein
VACLSLVKAVNKRTQKIGIGIGATPVVSAFAKHVWVKLVLNVNNVPLDILKIKKGPLIRALTLCRQVTICPARDHLTCSPLLR